MREKNWGCDIVPLNKVKCDVFLAEDLGEGRVGLQRTFVQVHAVAPDTVFTIERESLSGSIYR